MLEIFFISILQTCINLLLSLIESTLCSIHANNNNKQKDMRDSEHHRQVVDL